MGAGCAKGHDHQLRTEVGAVETVLRKCLFCRYVHYKVAGPEECPELLPYVQALVDATLLFSPTAKTRPVASKLNVKKVVRNTNMFLYATYSTTRHEFRESRKGKVVPVEVKTQEKAQEMQSFRHETFGGHETTRPLESEINEVYLWHGTSYSAVTNIFQHDFRMGHKAHRGLFGQGLYFAESCAKADEYSSSSAHDQSWYCRPGQGGEDDSLKDGVPVCVMLLCRVVLGKVKTVQRSTDEKLVHTESHGDKEEEYDALIGARERHRREFILTSSDAVYPEFAVLYQRDKMRRTEDLIVESAAVCPETVASVGDQDSRGPAVAPSCDSQGQTRAVSGTCETVSSHVKAVPRPRGSAWFSHCSPMLGKCSCGAGSLSKNSS